MDEAAAFVKQFDAATRAEQAQMLVNNGLDERSYARLKASVAHWNWPLSEQNRSAAHQPEVVAQGVEVSILKDWPDYGLLGISLALAFVACFQYRIARLAYLVNRPYVIVEKVTLLNLTTAQRADSAGLGLMVAQMVLENAGAGPAVIRAIRGKLKLLADEPAVSFPAPPDEWGDLKECEPLATQKRVIGGSRRIEVLAKYDKGLLSEADYKAVKQTYDKHLVFYGVVKYSAVSGWRRYKLHFGFQYSPPGLIGSKGFFAVGPAKYNRNT